MVKKNSNIDDKRCYLRDIKVVLINITAQCRLNSLCTGQNNRIMVIIKTYPEKSVHKAITRSPYNGKYNYMPVEFEKLKYSSVSIYQKVLR